MANFPHYNITRPDGTEAKYARVSTILNVIGKGESLDTWRESVGLDAAKRELEHAQDIGTQFHKWIEAWIADRNAPVPDGMGHMAEHFLRAMHALSPSFRAVERVVASHVNEYAGTADAVARVGGRDVLLDWKSSGMIPWTYALQTTAYTEAWNETVAGDLPTLTYPAIIVRVDKWTPEQHAERQEARRARVEEKLAAMLRDEIPASPEEIDRARTAVKRFRKYPHKPMEIVYAPDMGAEWDAVLRLYRARSRVRFEPLAPTEVQF